MTEFRFGGWRVRFRMGFALLTLGGIIATVELGKWQTRRAEQKLELQARMDALARGPVLSLPPIRVKAASYANSRVSVRGTYLAKYTMFVDNRVLHGAPGYYVVTPLRIQGSDMYVLVNRGWVGVGRSRERLPRVPTPPAEQTVEGIAVIPPTHVYELARGADAGPLIQHIVLAHVAEHTGLKLQPIVLRQVSAAADGLAREWPRPDFGVNMHRAYALQWYVMAAVIGIVYVALNVRRAGGDSARGRG